MQKERQITKKKMSESKAEYNGTLIDFIQNIFTVIELTAEKFTNKRII